MWIASSARSRRARRQAGAGGRAQGRGGGGGGGGGAAGGGGADGEYKIILPGLRRVIAPKTAGQRDYLHAIAQHDIVIGIGPAGTGKTYLAVAAAVDALART